MMLNGFLIFAAIIIIIILIAIIVAKKSNNSFIESPQKQVGRRGEMFARLVIQEGYVFFVQGNSPIQSDYIVETQGDIDRIIHSGNNQHIPLKVIESVMKTLK